MKNVSCNLWLFKGTEKPQACYIPLASERPKVEIHYEPLNTDSQSFVLSQLDHLRTHVDEIAVLDIIPFGRTVRNDSTRVSFQCPNDAECNTYKHHVCNNAEEFYNKFNSNYS
jgi:hypothetical protein